MYHIARFLPIHHAKIKVIPLYWISKISLSLLFAFDATAWSCQVWRAWLRVVTECHMSVWIHNMERDLKHKSNDHYIFRAVLLRFDMSPRSQQTVDVLMAHSVPEKENCIWVWNNIVLCQVSNRPFPVERDIVSSYTVIIFALADVSRTLACWIAHILSLYSHCKQWLPVGQWRIWCAAEILISSVSSVMLFIVLIARSDANCILSRVMGCCSSIRIHGTVWMNEYWCQAVPNNLIDPFSCKQRLRNI